MANDQEIYHEAFEAFMATDAEDAIIKSTRASWGGSGYSVELFGDSTYRVLWDNQIGNCYESPGIIIGIPTLDADEWDEEEEGLSFFDNALDELRERFAQ